MSDEKTIMDVGCGSVFGLLPLESENVIHIDIEVTDFNKSILEVQCDAHNLPFKEDSVDIVYCSHTLEHCENPLMVLRELKRVSKKMVVVRVPCLNASIAGEGSGHLFTWSQFSLTNLLRRVFPKVKVSQTSRQMLYLSSKAPFLKKTLSLILLNLFKDELTAIAYKVGNKLEGKGKA